MPSRKVLLVEDSAIVRSDVTKLLTTMGLEVYPTQNGEEAWRYLEKNKGNAKGAPDAIFSDINMPIMDGLQLLDKVRHDKCYAEIPFVILTSNKEELLRVTALCLNVTSFFIKPPDPKLIQSQLNKIFQPKSF